MRSKYCRTLFVILVALMVLSIGAFNWLRPGSAHASSSTATFSTHSQMARHPGHLAARAETCSEDLALGIVGAQLFNPSAPGLPGLQGPGLQDLQAVPISPLELANLQNCTP